MSYTKGKWTCAHVNHGNSESYVIREEKTNAFIAETGVWTKQEHDELLANARLIAAAPELLEACKKSLDTVVWALSELTKQGCVVNGSLNQAIMACQDLQQPLQAAISAAESR